MARIPAAEQVQVNFRMPADLKARIEAAAEANGRSTTAELVAALEEKYPAPDTSFTVEDMVARIKRLRDLAGDDPAKIAEADALERAAILSLLGALGLDPVESGFGHLVAPPDTPKD